MARCLIAAYFINNYRRERVWKIADSDNTVYFFYLRRTLTAAEKTNDFSVVLQTMRIAMFQCVMHIVICQQSTGEKSRIIIISYL